ncbi:transposase [Falsigemmobacter faecalis]|uniref:transposase n=1 Tax=Falsigemmobacter faecalis TaxID=2488730 RepID=UPI002697D2F4
MESFLALSGLSWSVPIVGTSATGQMSDPPLFSTLSRRQTILKVAIPDRAREGLHLLINIEPWERHWFERPWRGGIKVAGEGEWRRRKHGGSKRRIWRRIHITVDEKTLEIRAIGITSGAIGDAPVLPDLLSQIAPQEEIAPVTADGACDTRACHDAIAARGAKNARLWKPTTEGARAREDAVRSSKRFGRALWRKWREYHRRSRGKRR